MGVTNCTCTLTRWLAGGTIERPLLTLDWRDLASLGPETLAVPQRRIEYVKYVDALVWDYVVL